MNYYNRHIGDYARDTAHLTFTEDGAYNRMLDYYYATEAPLPLDRALLYRKVRARSKLERATVDALLSEFFREDIDGWHKRRCDEEIEKCQKKAEKNRENGKQGGRPPKNPDGTQMVSKPNPNETLASSQEPVAKNQEPKTEINPLARSDKSPSLAEPVNDEAVAFIPIVGGSDFGVSRELLAELEAAYPQVDVPQTLKEIRVWCVANPTKRKTARGAARFINRWCERVQNGG